MNAISLTNVTMHRCKGYPFSVEIITHAMWLYFRFLLSLHHVEYLLAERGIEVSFQTIAE
ncbi:putative transposase [Brucella grignonensis]|uniref:Putative transposase n=1 Tax=Brucella grignonensis TaxID=94627 RepID=A0A256F0M9_9HYPH|nr:putative transposase [Brucella grignonensis]